LIPELVLIDGVRESKQDAIRAITEALYPAGRTEDALLIEEALWDREACRAKDLRHQPSQQRVHTARVLLFRSYCSRSLFSWSASASLQPGSS